MLFKEKGFLWKVKMIELLMENKSCDSWWWKVKTHKNWKEKMRILSNKIKICGTTCQWQYRPAVCGGATGVASYEWSGLSHSAGRGDHTFFCVGAWYWAGTCGNQKAFRMILTPTSAKAVTARVTEAAPLKSAHKALRNHLVKTLPVLLGNEDPDKHCGIRGNRWIN